MIKDLMERGEVTPEMVQWINNESLSDMYGWTPETVLELDCRHKRIYLAINSKKSYGADNKTKRELK